MAYNVRSFKQRNATPDIVLPAVTLTKLQQNPMLNVLKKGPLTSVNRMLKDHADSGFRSEKKLCFIYKIFQNHVSKHAQSIAKNNKAA